jgi:hypothetical protein
VIGFNMPSKSENSASIGYKEFIANAAFTAIAWVVLYELNAFLFSKAEVGDYVSWVFLPAAVRIIAVLLAGYAGALGLFVGAFITNEPTFGVDFLQTILLSLLSALGPVIAVMVTLYVLRIAGSLSGLRWWHLIAFAIAGAIFNVLPTHMFLRVVGEIEDVSYSFGAMLAGDLIGTLIVLSMASFVAKLVLRAQAKQ